MKRFRSFAWLIALIAFVVPSLGTAAIAHAIQPAGEMASVDCPDHAPPPPDCPAQGTAKHAAGQCCPFMSGVVALLPSDSAVQTMALFHGPPARSVQSFVGLDFTKDPPPPRL